MDNAEKEKEEALKTPVSTGADTPTESNQKSLFTPKTGEEYKALAENPADITPTLNTPDTEDEEETVDGEKASRGLMKAAGLTEEGLPQGLKGATVSPATKAESFIDKAKRKGTGWAEKQTAKAIENASAPDTRYDLAGNTLAKANEEGLAANRAIQNTEIPKWKRATLNDVLFNPAYEGIRDSIISQAINARGANLLKGLAGRDSNYASAVDRYNKEQADRYSNAIADRDKRAADIQMSDIEAANKRDVGETLQRADFNVDRELDRAGLLYDTETKRQVLNAMIKDSKAFAEKMPNPEDRMLLTAYQQYLGGDASMLDSLLSVYGPQLAEKLSPLVNKLLGVDADNTNEWNTVATSFGGHDYTVGEIENLGAQGFYNAMTRAGLTNEQKEEIISGLERGYGTTGGMRELRDAFEGDKKGQAVLDAANEQSIKETNERAETLETSITETMNNANLTEKQKKKILTDLQTQLDMDKKRGLLADTQALKTATTNLNNAIAKNNLAIEVKGINTPLQKNVKLKLKRDGKNEVLDKKDADSSLSYLSTLSWNKMINDYTGSVPDRATKIEAVKGTQGYQDVVDFLKNDKVQAYAYANKVNNYKYAVNNFLKTFGGTAQDYGFLVYE